MTRVPISAPPAVSVGVSTYFGVLGTIAGAAGALVAAAKANDVATVTAGVATIATALTTLGGRMAQAVALARRVAPLVQAGAAGVAGVAGLSNEHAARVEVARRTIADARSEPGDVLDGLPDILTAAPVPIEEHEGDPLTRGEVPS